MVRKKFIAPRVLQVDSVQLERSILVASVRFNMTVASMGQEIEEHSFDPTDSDADLEAYWE